MAKELGAIIIKKISSDSDGEIITSGISAAYTVCDSGDKDMQKSSTVVLDDVDTSDTVAQWWAKIQGQVKTLEGIE